MNSIQLFTQSFRLLWEHRNQAFILAIPVIVINLISLFIQPNDSLAAVSTANLLLSLILFILSFVVSVMMSIGWHRAELLGEKAEIGASLLWRPQFWGYLGRLILIILVVLAIYFAFMLIAGLVFGGIISSAPGTANMGLLSLLGVLFFIGILFLYALVMRLSLILPACSVERPISMSEALQSTKGRTLMILGYMLLMALTAIALMLPLIGAMQAMITNVALGFPTSLSIAASLYITLVSMVMTFVGLAGLTLLYAHYVGSDHKAAEVFE